MRPRASLIENLTLRCVSRRLTDVCSKRFLTSKVDRSVTGLVAQQQCVGPLLLPLSDFALVATSHQDTTGLATSIGEQPYKGLIDPAAMARLAVGEAVTNLAMCKITALADVRASVNWMHAAKMGCEGAAMYESGESTRACGFILTLSLAWECGGMLLALTGGEEVSLHCELCRGARETAGVVFAPQRRRWRRR